MAYAASQNLRIILHALGVVPDVDGNQTVRSRNSAHLAQGDLGLGHEIEHEPAGHYVEGVGLKRK